MNVQKRKTMKFAMKVEGLEGRDLQAAFHPGAVATPNPQPLPPVAALVRLNPQPLPPHSPLLRLNPQPLPPISSGAFHSLSLSPQVARAGHGIIIVGG